MNYGPNGAWVANIDSRDHLLRWVELRIGRYTSTGAEVLRPDGTMEPIREDVYDDGEPALRIPRPAFDALLDACERELAQRRPDPGIEAEVLREALELERSRVNHSLRMPTTGDPT